MTIGRLPSVEGGIQPTIVDAKGDLITATAADTPARLAVGTNGQYLSADSTASTGLAWASVSAGGMTLLSTTSLTGSSVTVSSISQSYKHLLILCKEMYLNQQENVNYRLNGDTGSNYFNSCITFGSTTVIGNSSGTSNILSSVPTGTGFDEKAYFEFWIYRYAETEYKIGVHRHRSKISGTTYQSRYGQHAYNSTTAISSFTLFPDAGTFSGGTLYIYGVS
jgi:hypothetical protein